MEYAAAIGLEVHVQLDTKSKMFCGCGTRYGAPPNTQVCPVCLGYPGAMPVMNRAAIDLTVLTGLSIGSRIPPRSRFDRKSYFYPDMPKNYQISQYDQPLCVGGAVEIPTRDGRRKAVGVRRIHLEEDVGKNMHFRRSSGIDFNRAGVPLMEIVTEPDLETPDEAHDFLVALKRIVTYAGVSRCNLEEGNLRCDVNCSLRPAGSDRLGTKTEIKNMNSFRGVLNALRHEIARQTEVLTSGGAIRQETRRWDADAGVTLSMRAKEQEHDYRYFPEPDLMPVVLADDEVDRLRQRLPEMPEARRRRLAEQYGIPDYDAGVLAGDRELADYFEQAAALSPRPKSVANWVMTEVMRVLSERNVGIREFTVRPEALAALAGLVEDGTVNGTTAKEVFEILCATGGDPVEIVRTRGLAQVSETGAIAEFVRRALEENPKSVADFRGGKETALQFLVGQAMRMSKGKANPQAIGAMLRERIEPPA